MPNLEGPWRVPPRRTAADHRGMEVLEQKLSILTQGPSRTRRNPALDVLTGRVPDERLAMLQASLAQLAAPAVAADATGLAGAGAAAAAAGAAGATGATGA